MKTNAADEQGLRAKAYKVIAKLKNRSVATALQLWQDAVADDQTLKTDCDRKEQEREAKTRKAVQRLVNRALVGCFEAWSDHVCEEARRRSKVRRILLRLMNRALVESFEHWREEVTGEKQMKAKALKVVQRLMNRALIDGFERWREDVVGERQMKAKALKVVQRLVNRVLITAFDAWNQAIAEERLAADEALRAEKGTEDADLRQMLQEELEARKEAERQVLAAVELKEALARRVAQLEEATAASADDSMLANQGQLSKAEGELLENRRLLDSLRVDCERSEAERRECEQEAATEKERLNGEIDTLRFQLQQACDDADADGAQRQLKLLREALEKANEEAERAETCIAELAEGAHQRVEVVGQLLQEAAALKRAKPLPLTPHPAPPCASEEVQTLKQQLAEEAMRARELKELAGTRQEDLVKHQQQLALANVIPVSDDEAGKEVVALRRRVEEQGRRAGELHREREQAQQALELARAAVAQAQSTLETSRSSRRLLAEVLASKTCSILFISPCTFRPCAGSAQRSA